MPILPPALGDDESKNLLVVFSDKGKRPGTFHIESQLRSRVSQLRIKASLVNLPERVKIGFFKLANLKSHANIVAGKRDPPWRVLYLGWASRLNQIAREAV